MIPASTVAALENLLDSSPSSGDYEKIIFVIQNAVRSGQPVSHQILQIFVDHLFTSTNSRRRLKAFKALDKSLNNQPDLPDNIFFATEMQRAAFGISIANKVINIIF